MGTVIIFKGEAYVFLNMEPVAALQSFIDDWGLNVVTGVQLFPINGTGDPQGFTISIVKHDSWGKD